jgi:uncharacterized membrane protein
MAGLSSHDRHRRLAVGILAVVLVVAAVAFGIWATVVGNSAVFGRLTGLPGVFSLVLAVVITGTGMITRARDTQEDKRPASGTAQMHKLTADRLHRMASDGLVAPGDIPYPDASQPVRLAPRPAFLAAREELLAALDAELTATPERAGPRLVALCGLGGAGKTSVAVKPLQKDCTLPVSMAQQHMGSP